MAAFLDNVRFTPTAGGTADWTYSTTVTGYQSPSAAGAVNSAVYELSAISADLSQWEIARGAYNSGTGVFARTTVLYNSSGTGTAAGQSGAGTKINFTNPPKVAIVALAEDLVNTPGCGRLTYVSATAIKFSPYDGDLIKINGSIYKIPTSGISGVANTSVYVNGVAGQNLAASSLYYVYAFMNAGTITADFSTTAHATSTTAGNEGVEIKSGDDTRTLIGMVCTNSSSQFTSSATQRLVISWFNRLPIGLKNNFTTTRTNATAVGAGPAPTMTEVNSEIQIQFLCWSIDAVTLSVSGSFFNSGANTNVASIGVDNTTSPEDVFAVMTGTSAQPLAMTHTRTYGEGFHYATILNGVSAGTASYYVFGNSAGGRTTLNGQIMG